MSVKGENFLLVEDGADDKIIISATNEHLRRLAEADIAFVHGTFQTCPRLFYQIFTIHAILNGRHVPLVYYLLPNMRQETYERVFQLLEDKVRAGLQLELLSTTVLSDYELAIILCKELSYPPCRSRAATFTSARSFCVKCRIWVCRANTGAVNCAVLCKELLLSRVQGQLIFHSDWLCQHSSTAHGNLATFTIHIYFPSPLPAGRGKYVWQARLVQG